MKILVIGGAGRMGSWFTRYFRHTGHHVAIADINRRAAKRVSVETAAEIRELRSVEKGEFDVILISVPIEKTIALIRAVARRKLKPRILLDISSLKLHTARALKQVSAVGATVVSVHPLFGRGAKLSQQLRFALIPLQRRSEEQAVIKALFPGSRVVTMDAATHDRAVAFTLWLTYFINIAYAAVLSRLPPQFLRPLSSPRFELQAMLVGSCLTDDPALYDSLFQGNAYSTEALAAFRDAVQTVSNACGRPRESAGLVALFRKALAGNLVGKKAYEQVYDLATA